MANETPRTPERLSFLGRLIAKVREEDGSRLVSAALEKKTTNKIDYYVEDELISLTDLIGFNQYVGWYDGTPANCDTVIWHIPGGKPVVVSEFGGGALYGNHGASGELFTEEYLEWLYQKNIEMMSKMPGLAGISPWCLKDFRSPKRTLVGIQDEFNRKGLIDERGNRKKAFFVLKNYYKNRD